MTVHTARLVHTSDLDAETLRNTRLMLDEAYAVEDHGWKQARRSALALDSRMGAFFRRFAHAAARAGSGAATTAAPSVGSTMAAAAPACAVGRGAPRRLWRPTAPP